MISLTIAPIISGWEDWQFWYWGLLPIGLCVIATGLVHHYFWKNTQDIAAPIEELVKEEKQVDVEAPAAVDDVEATAAVDDAKPDEPAAEQKH